MKKLIIYYFFFLLSIFSLLSSGVIDSQDGFQYLAVARNIYYKGEPTAPPYEYDKRKNIHMTVQTGKDNKLYSLTGLGYSLAYLPAVAFTDIVYRFYNLVPPDHFPLENDWLIFLISSFTNGFFAALLGGVLFLYLVELGLSKKQALIISFIGLLSTNLLVYTKHSFAHMMFTAFLFTSFFLIKKHFQTKRNLYLLLAGLSFGITSISYNQTFLLSVIPLGLYFLLLSSFRLNLVSIRSIFSKSLIFLLGSLPFIIIYLWFENVRAATYQNLAEPLAVVNRGIQPLRYFRIGIFFEGVYGQLFSPGRSIFLYSPILLIPIIFWRKIKINIKPELIVFISLSMIYISFFATQYSGGAVDQGLNALWHGEVSWGPRYLIPLIPFGILIIGGIYRSISKRVKYYVFYPLVIFGLFIEILGVLVPYQTKLYNLQEKFFLNGNEYYSSVYTNLLPRYSPVISMSKNLVKLAQNFPKTFSHGIYNVRFYDGIDFPFNVGPERWRVIENTGYIYFDNRQAHPVKTLSFGLINHVIAESSASATLNFSLNNKPLSEQSFVFEPRERKIIKVSIPSFYLVNTDNLLEIKVQYSDPLVEKEKRQILGMVAMSVNDSSVNLESIDPPYVSNLGSAMGLNYRNWGGTNQDPWKTWHIHTQMFERLPDLWWIRNLYYWDIPKAWILIPFSINILALIFFAFKLFGTIRNR